MDGSKVLPLASDASARSASRISLVFRTLTDTLVGDSESPTELVATIIPPLLDRTRNNGH
jgi:hypothetical protein